MGELAILGPSGSPGPSAGFALIGLGANLPFEGLEGPGLLHAALTALEAQGVRIARVSQCWRSAAWPPSDQPPFTNAVAEVYTDGRDPQALWTILESVERAFGRQRRVRWAARTLDLDLLDHEGAQGVWGEVEVPHPRMGERAFVLAPLLELRPDWRCPRTGEAGSALLERLRAVQPIERLTP